MLPAMVIDTSHEHWARVRALDEGVAAIERRLAAGKKEDAARTRLMDISVVGRLTATTAETT